jgi:signal transduction histidine kinase/ligand-binding sensor domain-containing protein
MRSWVSVVLIAGVLATLSSAMARAMDTDRTVGQLHHTAWTPKDGAPPNASTIVQTSDGWLWFGSTSGLYRFDGLRFERVEVPWHESRRSQVISALLPLETGELWIGHGRAFGGASVLKGGRFTHFDETKGFGEDRVLAFEQDADGTLWAATANGLMHFDGERWSNTAGTWSFRDNRSVPIARDSNGVLWVAGATEVFSLPRGSRSFEPSGVVTTSQATLVRSPDGRVWYADASSARLLSAQRGSDTGLKEGTTRASSPVLMDRDGNVWSATRQGLRRSRGDNDAQRVEAFTANNGLSGEIVNTILEDREGNLWTTTPGGVDRFRHTNISRLPPSLGAPPGVGLAAGDRGVVWMASQEGVGPAGNGGIWRFDGGLHHVQPKEIPSATAIHRDTRGSVWIGAPGGIWRYDGARFDKVIEPPAAAGNDLVQALAVDATGDVWVAFVDSGLYRFHAGTWQRNGGLEELPDIRPTIMTSDSSGRLWFGYRSNQLALIDQGRATLFGERDGLQIATIVAISTGRYVLVGGDGGVGLVQAGRVRMLRLEDRPTLDPVVGIVETGNGDVWLNSWGGALRIAATDMKQFEQDARYGLSVEVFDAEDGYPGPGPMSRPRPFPSMAAATDGRIWLVGQDGLAWIDPDRVRRNTVPPGVIVRSLRADGSQQSLTPNGLQALPKDTRTVEIEYAGISHSHPERVQFRYRLEGIDKDWVHAGTRREVFYSNLGPGQYRFRIMAANEYAVWNESGATLAFAIPPLFWQTRTFMVLCVATALGVLIALFRFRVHQVTTRERAWLEARLAERERIARELHDTLLQSVQGLLLRLQLVLDRIPEREPAREMMEQALDRAESALIEGRDRVRDLRSGDVAGASLAESLRDAGNELEQNKVGTQLRVVTQGSARPLHPIVRDEAYWIGREALINAFRHSNASAVEVEVRYGWRALRVHVRDNGGGIAAGVLESGGRGGHWGLPGMHERARKIRARLQIWSAAGAGTEVELRVPATLAYRKR